MCTAISAFVGKLTCRMGPEAGNYLVSHLFQHLSTLSGVRRGVRFIEGILLGFLGTLWENWAEIVSELKAPTSRFKGHHNSLLSSVDFFLSRRRWIKARKKVLKDVIIWFYLFQNFLYIFLDLTTINIEWYSSHNFIYIWTSNCEISFFLSWNAVLVLFNVIIFSIY